MTTSSPPPSLPSGTILKDRYRLQRVIGEGGMGIVYEAIDESLSRPVAVKILNSALAGRKVTAKRFENEARAIATIRSEHIVEVYDIGRTGKLIPGTKDAPFMVMEYLKGKDLAELLVKRKKIGDIEAVGYVLEALLAIVQAHSRGIVHRDLKPANLFLAQNADGSKRIKVLDFGVSKLSGDLGRDRRLTSDSQVLGSPAYMAPEQLRQSNKVDARADIWSVGVILYELMTGRLPFDASTTGALFAAILEKPPHPMLRHCPELSPDLERVVLRCLAKRPENRWASVVELSNALQPFGPAHSQDSVQRIARLASIPSITDDSSTEPELMTPAELLMPSSELVDRASDGPPRLHAHGGTLEGGGALTLSSVRNLRKRGRLVALALGGAAAIGGAVLGVALLRSPTPQNALSAAAPPKAIEAEPTAVVAIVATAVSVPPAVSVAPAISAPEPPAAVAAAAPTTTAPPPQLKVKVAPAAPLPAPVSRPAVKVTPAPVAPATTRSDKTTKSDLPPAMRER